MADDLNTTHSAPPLHTTFATRGIHPPLFSSFRPREHKIATSHPLSHVAWSCDGKKLAAVGTDKTTRVWTPEKSMEPRTASFFTGAHSDEVDYVAWNPTHPDLFCTSSQKDRRIVFWDARQSRAIQQILLRSSPMQLHYSPDGRTIAVVSIAHQLSFLSLGKESEDTKETWRQLPKDSQVAASTAIFTNAGDALIITHYSEHTVRVIDWPTLKLLEHPAAHVQGCIAVAQDPRGKYLASGGFDSIVNLFDTSEWICARTITSCDHSINSLAFSHDGEYLAISSTGSYINICSVETGEQMHRINLTAPVPSVTWHPSKYAFAYCGPPGVVGLFGLSE